jgi:hypothetical protein
MRALKMHAAGTVVVGVFALTACGSAESEVAAPSTVTETIDRTVERTVTVTESPTEEPEPEPTMSSSPRPAPSGAGMMDEIYAQMMRDEGIEVSNGEFAQLSASVCDTFDSGGSQADALGVIQDATGETGWRGTRILQAAVVNKCGQHVDYTY